VVSESTSWAFDAFSVGRWHRQACAAQRLRETDSDRDSRDDGLLAYLRG